MKKLGSLLIFSMGLLFLSCSQISSNTEPKTILLTFFQLLSKKDIENARKYATTDSKSMLDMMQMGIKMSNDPSEDNKFDKNNMEFGAVIINGDNATIPVIDKRSNDRVDFLLKKENGEWKVAFDLGTIMTIGIDKMKQSNPKRADSLKKQMGGLKNMNIDSLRRLMKNAAVTLDSLKSELKKKGTQ